VTLIEGCAHDGTRSGADCSLAGVSLGTQVAVITRRAVRLTHTTIGPQVDIRLAHVCLATVMAGRPYDDVAEPIPVHIAGRHHGQPVCCSSHVIPR